MIYISTYHSCALSHVLPRYIDFHRNFRPEGITPPSVKAGGKIEIISC